MYFMKNSLHMAWLGKIFALGALSATFLAGNLPQVNSMTKMLAPWNVDKTLAGVVITFFVGAVVLGGIQRIGQVTRTARPLYDMYLPRTRLLHRLFPLR